MFGLSYSQTSTLKGKITDGNGFALPGATIQASPSGKAVVTDFNGFYTIVGIDGEQTIKVSYIGFETVEQVISIEDGSNSLDFTLETAVSELAQVVVSGFQSGIIKGLNKQKSDVNVTNVVSADADTYDNEIGLEKQLRLVARLIKGGLGSKIYMVSIGGFDTHGNQSLTHEVLLTYVADAIKKFYDDLNYEGLDSKVLSMTFSEFGRRVKENGSQGTDHGSAAPTLLFGPALRGSGIIGDWPSLDNLNRRGNMYNSIDFRSIYQAILKDWLCGDSEYIDKAMLGNEYDALGLGFGCGDLDIVDYNDLFNYHHPIYTNSANTVNLNLRIKQTHKVNIRIYDILGRHINTVFEGELTNGEHSFPLSHNQGGKISSGQYFYRIGISGGQTLSKSFVVR